MNYGNFNNIKFLLTYAWKYKKSLFLLYLLNILFTLVFYLSGILAPRELVAELTGGRRISIVIMVAGIFLLAASVSGFFRSYIKSFYISILQELRAMHMRRIQRKSLKMEFAMYEDPKRLDNDWMVYSAVSSFQSGVQSVYMRLFAISANIVAVCFYIGILSSLNLWVLLFLAANLSIVFFVTLRAQRYDIKTTEEEIPFWRKEHYLNEIMYTFSYGKDIRVYGLSNWIYHKFRDNFSGRKKVQTKIENAYLTSDSIGLLLALLRDGVAYGFLIYGTFTDRIAISNFIMYFMTLSSLSILMEQILKDTAFVYSQQERISQYRTYVDGPDESSGGVCVQPADQYMIEFKNVYFSYPGTDTTVYEDLNFKIASGEKLAVVGINGAGKTTLVKLLLRFYKPDSGEILLNGVNINEYNVYEYRKLFSAVFQEINLFAMSLGENIGLEKMENLDEERLSEAVRKAGFDERLSDLPNGFRTQVLRDLYPDGLDFSGGEKQKIAIARALYRQGQVYILDEPTAALDAIAEYNLYKELADMFHNKTLVFISHRLASTRFCDRIMLIGGKRVQELGTHEELMARQGYYYDMFTAQSKYYVEDGQDEE